MPMKFDVSDEKSVHIATGYGPPVEIGLLVNDVPAFVTEVDDGNEVFELEAETGNDRATIVLFDDKEATREHYE